mmetsp:Transcript_20646/g.42988  ORF Transcript_20646/g.42988 Transcript_20646/m.42988 type:complete len:305 (-) Transcript_20646:226-1140(-)
MSSTLNDRRFLGKKIIITGAGGNFGRDGCIFFACRGACVAAMDNNADALNETIASVESVCEEMRQGSVPEECIGKIKGYTCDVTNVGSVEDAVKSVGEDFGGIDMLWNNAGYQGQIKPTLEYDPKDFATVMNINVTGMFIVLQSVAKRMSAQNNVEYLRREGSETNGSSHPFSIVNTASVAALRGTPAMVAYSSSKAAILAMTVSSAKDLAPHGIRVNAVSPALIGPGYMWTRQNELHAQSGSPYFPDDPEKVAAAKIGGVPMKRLGTINEVINSVAYLLSDDSSYTTGTNLVVDGGLSSGLKA